MRLLHDQLYGKGTGLRFLLGDYLDDLPRAVRKRIVLAEDPENDAPAANGCSPLTQGAELKVVNVTTNDVLTMRENATDNSPVIDIISPNAKGVMYLGESHGQWIFVRYDRAKAKGWVNCRFVTPIAPAPSKGGHD
jgi:hypothetical protein